MSYPGGKAGDGVLQTLINAIPPHDVYIEPFLGGGAIMRHKRAAARSVGIDCDNGVIACWRQTAATLKRPDITLHAGDGIAFLEHYPWRGREFVYCDPPYMPSTRARYPMYAHEMGEEDHTRLLKVLTGLPCAAMVSGYWTPLYADTLVGWRSNRFAATTRGGLGDEWLWMNYGEPTALHDYRYLGHDYRARERIKRQQTRWVARFRRLPVLERFALLEALQNAAHS